jgi:hypothetical protein
MLTSSSLNHLEMGIAAFFDSGGDGQVRVCNLYLTPNQYTEKKTQIKIFMTFSHLLCEWFRRK